MATYTRNLSEPWFSLVSVGAKTVEGRLGTRNWAEIEPGSTIMFINDELGRQRTTMRTVAAVAKYDSVEAMLEGEGLEKCLPTIPNVRFGVAVYRRFYTDAQEKEHGVLAFRLE